MYEYRTRVAPSDVYSDGLMTPMSMARLMQDCSQLWMESEPVLKRWLVEQDNVMLIASRQMDIARRPAMGEDLATVTSIYAVKGFLGYRNTFIFDVNGHAVAKSWAVGAFASIATGTMTSMPPDIASSVTLDARRIMDYTPRKIKLPNVAPTTMPILRAVRSDIDFNGHINNANYVRMAWEYVPKNTNYARLRVEYKEQGREGCEIHPVVFQENDRTVVKLENTEDRLYAIVELSTCR